MSIENPISTIRKAIQGKAEAKASKEFLDKPEERHYKEAFHFYKTLRAIAPEKVELIITVGANAKDLKDEMGVELFKIFNRVLENITDGSEKQFNEAVEQIKATKKLSNQELGKEILELNERFIKEKVTEVKNDPRIIEAFTGKDELLNKGLDFASLSTMKILEAYEKSPAQLRELSLKEFVETMTRYKRGKPTSTELRENLLQKDKLPKKLFSKIINYFRGID